ncbi:MAG: PEP-CTERM sorting domain-containing protein, partial [Phycisphaerae bacterium]
EAQMSTKFSSVTSAADGCGKPSSIRAMGSSNSSNMERKESFMFSNRSSVISRGCSLAAATIAVAAVVGLAGAASASAVTIYADNFTGSASAPLAGTSPSTDLTSATWSGSGWYANGATNGVDTSNTANLAYLPISVSDGNVYTISAVLDPNAGTNGDWFAIGFSTPGGIWGGGPGPAILLGNTGTAKGYAVGVTTGAYNNSASNNTFPLDKLAQVSLDTTSSNWTATYSYDGTTIATYTYTGASGTYPNPAGSDVAFIYSYGQPGSVSDFSVTGPAVPEPATLGLTGVGGIALLLLGRKRAAHRSM